ACRPSGANCAYKNVFDWTLLPGRGPMMVRSRWAANAVLHAGFVLAGVVTVLIGPMLPFLIARWSMSDERAGLFFSFQFGGNLGGIASLGTLLSRRGYSAVFLVGFTCIAVGVA